MKVVGLTGGIGSGKSLVAQIFTSIGVPVFNSDLAGRQVLDTDKAVVKAVTELFGKEIYRKGVPDRKRISDIVFNDENALHSLNAIIHPAVKRLTEAWVKEHQTAVYGLKEAAILFESGAAKQCDRMICVLADEATRILRVKARDGLNEAEARGRMSNQWPQERIASLSDHHILNDGSKSVILQVAELHRSFIDTFQ